MTAVMTSSRRASALVVAGLFALSGVAHLVRPAIFRPLLPKALPRQTELIYISGVAELVCSVGLVTRQPWAGPGSTIVLLGVWPGNFTQAYRVTDKFGIRSWQAVVAWTRIPLQVPMIWAALDRRE